VNALRAPDDPPWTAGRLMPEALSRNNALRAALSVVFGFTLSVCSLYSVRHKHVSKSTRDACRKLMQRCEQVTGLLTVDCLFCLFVVLFGFMSSTYLSLDRPEYLLLQDNEMEFNIPAFPPSQENTAVSPPRPKKRGRVETRSPTYANIG
jgi:hypothetical protein